MSECCGMHFITRPALQPPTEGPACAVTTERSGSHVSVSRNTSALHIFVHTGWSPLPRAVCLPRAGLAVSSLTLTLSLWLGRPWGELHQLVGATGWGRSPADHVDGKKSGSQPPSPWGLGASLKHEPTHPRPPQSSLHVRDI